MTAQSKLILALDVSSFAQAKSLISKLYSQIKVFKAGLELFTGAGPKVVELVRKKGGEVFLDLKFFDIPNTVANAVRQAVRLKVKMLTLHISGGREMLEAAVRAAKEEAGILRCRRPLLIGVTVLTSKKAASEEIVKLAKIGLECGLDGVVCSPVEARLLRKKIRKEFLIITPGIRPKGAPCDDQKRTATAREAINAGSDFLVVGRPILKAKDPLRAVKEIIGE